MTVECCIHRPAAVESVRLYSNCDADKGSLGEEELCSKFQIKPPVQ